MKTTVGIIELHGNPLTLVGEMVKVGDVAQDFTALGNDLKPVKLSDFAGKKIIISAMPSIDTPVCEAPNKTLQSRGGKT
jgi:thioredoxin-dependent peroxiredoxin